MNAVGAFASKKKAPPIRLRGLIERVVASSSLREKMLQLWIRGAGYQTEVPFSVTQISRPQRTRHIVMAQSSSETRLKHH
jgi:hypothetical protein